MKIHFRQTLGEDIAVLIPENDSESKEIDCYLGQPDSILTGSINLDDAYEPSNPHFLVHSVIIKRESELFELIKKKMFERNWSLSGLLNNYCRAIELGSLTDEQLLEVLRKD